MPTGEVGQGTGSGGLTANLAVNAGPTALGRVGTKARSGLTPAAAHQIEPDQHDSATGNLGSDDRLLQE